ncbi:MAG: sulfatase-like hydrolase/transferase [Clostridia bacterium]|nr:sulfatase-like hydrolase/transferase [Clostridia bacterium]
MSDELLYKQSIQEFAKSEEPIFAFISGASSHLAYYLDGIENREEKVKIDVGKYKNTMFGNYLEAVNYADYAFGIFIEELKEKDLYDDSVILVFGDHQRT